MNDICNACYSNTSLRATSRNLNIEDIENVLNISAWNPRSYEEGGYHTYTDKYKSENIKNYPYIWQYEEYANIGGVSNTDNRTIQILEGEGISRSTQPKNTEDEYGYFTQTYNVAQSYIQLTLTGWEKKISEKEVFNVQILNLLDLNALSTNSYWLSSRYTLGGIPVTNHSRMRQNR